MKSVKDIIAGHSITEECVIHGSVSVFKTPVGWFCPECRREEIRQAKVEYHGQYGCQHEYILKLIIKSGKDIAVTEQCLICDARLSSHDNNTPPPKPLDHPYWRSTKLAGNVHRAYEIKSIRKGADMNSMFAQVQHELFGYMYDQKDKIRCMVVK